MDNTHSIDELQDTKPTRKKRNPLRVFVILYLIPMGIGLGVYFVYDKVNGYQVRLDAIQAKLDQKIDELSANGEFVFFKELDRSRDPLPDSENGALLIEKLGEDCLEFDEDEEQHIWVFGELIDLGEPLDPVVLKQSHLFVDRNQNVLDSLDAILEYDTSRMKWIYAHDSLNLAPEISCSLAISSLRKLLLLDAYLSVIDGQSENSAVRIRQIFRMGTYLGREPVSSGYSGSARSKNIGAYGLEMILNHAEYSPDVLLSIQRELELILDESSLYPLCLADRAMVIVDLERLIDEWKQDKDGVVGEDEYTDEIQLRTVQLSVLENFSSLLDTAETGNWYAYQHQLDQYYSDQKSSLASMEFPLIVDYLAFESPSARVFFAMQASHVYAKCALMGIGAERFRLDTGHWPGSLHELVPKYVESVAVDSFANQPLRYRRTEKGIVVYSVAYDGEDDGGQWPPGKKRLLNEEYDIVYELPDPDQRTPIQIQSESELTPVPAEEPTTTE